MPLVGGMLRSEAPQSSPRHRGGPVWLKESMCRMEAKLKISKTIWYTKWRRIYKDPNKEKRELAQGKRETIKKLMKFS